MKQQTTLITGALACGVAVALGAFGAHAWKAALVASSRFDTFETAVRYQMFHGLALLLTGVLMTVAPSPKLTWSAACFAGGIVLFSGSLYALCLTSSMAFALATPVGGVMFLGGWGFMGVSVMSPRSKV